MAHLPVGLPGVTRREAQAYHNGEPAGSPGAPVFKTDVTAEPAQPARRDTTMNEARKTYRRSTEETRAAKAIAESFSEQLQEILSESMEELKNTVDERLGKLEERLEALEETLDNVSNSMEDAHVDVFAEDIADIRDALQQPIIRQALRGAA
jgi:DNA anti-recombination protein RmuC